MFFLTAILIFGIGLCLGSFINVVILRMKSGRQFFKGRSCCPKCQKQIFWYDNIPILSFILLKGKCRFCHKKISWQYPIVELVIAVLFLTAFFLTFSQEKIIFDNFLVNFHDYPSIILVKLVRNWFFILILAIIFIYDLKYRIIPDQISLPSIILAILFNLACGFSFINLLISSIIGSVFFLIQFLISRGRWIGGGDIRLGALMGAMLGWPNVVVALFLAYVIGSIVSIGLVMFKNKHWKAEIPFAPFLTLGTLLSLFYGFEILHWYFSLTF